MTAVLPAHTCCMHRGGCQEEFGARQQARCTNLARWPSR